MSSTTDIGSRIELVPMDPHFHEITIGLYLQDQSAGTEFLVHSYSTKPGADDRLRCVVDAMVTMGGMERTSEGLLRFPCGHGHQLGCRRLFLESCKVDPQATLAVRPLSVFDKKAGCDIKATPNGGGVYGVGADSGDVERRIAAIAGGLIKLGEMEDLAADLVKFPCGQNHDELLGVLMVRAPNVRAVLREQEQTASRGQLAAPSQQE